MTAAAKKIPGWFSVDKEGLGKLVQRRGKAFAVFELVQNAWDEAGVTRVDVELKWLGRDRVSLIVTDDAPDGFHDLTHAFTLFAPSRKKGDPGLRGRFNLGEKLVLSICDRATITSTRGHVAFEADGTRSTGRARTERGTVFTAVVRMNRSEMEAAVIEATRLLPPPNVATHIGNLQLPVRIPMRVIPEVFLLTDVADKNGVVHRNYRDAEVHLHAVRPGERATLYELGIPVMELGDDPFHVDVRQKVPLSMERDGVPPGFLHDVRAAVLDHAHDLVSEKAAAGKWSQDAIEASESEEAVKALIAKRFGEKVVIADPSDVEGTKLAMAKGYTVIPGGAFTGDAWDKIREAKAALPAGQVTPSPKPFHPDGELLTYVDEDDLSLRARELRALVQGFADKVADLYVKVLFTKDSGWKFRAAYTKTGDKMGTVVFNLAKLDAKFWAEHAKQVELVVHELGHHWGGHLDESYHEAICRMAGNMSALSNIDWTVS